MQPLTPTHFLVDNSICDLITTCPRLAYYSVVLRRRPAAESAALRYGGFIHRCLAYRYKRIATGKPIDVNAQVRILDHCFTAKPCEYEGWRNVNSAAKTVRAYHQAWQAEPSSMKVLKKPNGLPFVEQPFSLDTGYSIRGRRIVYVGRIDLALHGPQGAIVRDHKTTSMLGNDFWAQESMSAQHRGYCWVLQQILGETPAGFEVNAVVTRESIENWEWDDTMRQLLPASPRTKSVPCDFAQQFFSLNKEQLAEWFDNLMHIVGGFLAYVDANTYPMHRKHCVGKYGQCQFYNICALADQQRRQEALDSAAYVPNTWTPLYV